MKNKVEQLRKERGLNQDDFAKMLRVSRQTISSIETGKYNPSLELAFAISDFFGKRIEEIFIYELGGEGRVITAVLALTEQQTSLGKADSAYQKPSGGIPSTDLTSEVQTTLGKVTDLERNQGDLSDLETTATDLVGAVNEVKGIADGKEGKNIIDSDTSTTAVSEALVVGKTYKYMPSAGVATLAFTLTPPTETDVVKFWRFKFKSGATATEFTPPSSLYWAGGKSLVPEANTIYEVMIDEDYCVSVLAFKQASA